MSLYKSLKRSATALCLLTLMLSQAFAQNNYYDWDKNRTWAKDVTEQDESLIMLKNHVQYDFEYDQNNLVVYKTDHRIYRVNNDEAVQRVNRIYIPLNDAIDIVAVKARTITKDGRVIELDQNNIKEVKDDEAGPGYKIFAIEGAEVGADIEYFYTKKAGASVFGRQYFQYGFPVAASSFRFTSPANLKFEFKSYNGFPMVVQDEGEMIKNTYIASAENLAPSRVEEFGSEQANRQRVEFKLSYNAAAGDKRLFTWNDAASRISSTIYPFSGTEKQALADLIKELKLKRLKTAIEKFAAVEHHVKNNFYMDDQATEGADQVDFILKNKYGTERGYTRLFAALAEVLELNYEMVLTSDRTKVRFDGQFESWNYLSDYLLYFEDTDQYMAPYFFQFRLGLWPPQFSATEGLFIKNQLFEGRSAPTGSIKKIPEMPYDTNLNQLLVKVSFNEDLSENTIDVRRSSEGYEGSFIKGTLSRANAEQKEEFLKQLLEFIGPNEEFFEMAYEGDDLDYNTWTDYLTYKGKFKTENFIEQAGDIILFKAGDLIGQQSELYQETARFNRVENDFNRGYLRKIEVDIPKGYTIQNPQDIDMDFEVEDKGKKVFIFKSTHEISGDKLLITIDEYYDQIYFPIERFEEFRKVINAAADWNKVVLVMQPN